MNRKAILFEPWAMGDALIAASALALRPDELVLVCQSRWHQIVLDAIPDLEAASLIGIETSYEAKSGKSGVTCSIDPRFKELNGAPVYSIRGDVRDYYLARKIFDRSRVRMTGWIPFVARKIPFFDLPFRHGICQAKNRYRMWMDLLGLEWAELESYYRCAAKDRASAGAVAIHVGAQWKSKQFPRVGELAALLRQAGKRVEILAGEGDPLPQGVSPSQVQVAMGRDLVERLKGCEFAVTNDSGPMHLAALLGAPTVAVGCSSNLACWAPPGVITVCAEKMPKGYAPSPGYWSEEDAKGWPAPEEIMQALRNGKLLQP